MALVVGDFPIFKRKMLPNVSYNDPKVTQAIEKVGKPFALHNPGLCECIPATYITACSVDIHNLLVLDQTSTNAILNCGQKESLFVFAVYWKPMD